jgi:hypothetical protein
MGLEIPAERVFFESTRSSKLARVRTVGCTYFIDDLEEVLTDPDFPAQTLPILFAATGVGTICRTWLGIAEVLLDGCR